MQEGDSGTTTLTFTARLIDPNGRAVASDKTITAQYQVLSEGGDTATAGTDYTATSGTLTFTPGEQIKTIAVSVTGDTDVEGDETLTVKWTGWKNVWLVRYTHTGTISNDDIIDSYPGLDSPSVQEGDSGTTTLTFTARLIDPNGRAVGQRQDDHRPIPGLVRGRRHGHGRDGLHGDKRHAHLRAGRADQDDRRERHGRYRR